MPRQPKRGQAVTPPRWWVDEVAKRLAGKGLTQRAVNDAIVSRSTLYDGRYGPLGKVDQSRVSRAIAGDPTPIGLLWLISSALGVPSPIIIPRRLSDARQINSFVLELSSSVDGESDLDSVDAEFSELEAGVADIAQRRQREVVSPTRGKVTKRTQS